jgi:hypothetical protein
MENLLVVRVKNRINMNKKKYLILIILLIQILIKTTENL